MAQWRVAQCNSAGELEHLVSSAQVDAPTRYYAAAKLVALDDRKRHTHLAKSSSMSFERFLKEHHSKHKIDWKNREVRPRSRSSREEEEEEEVEEELTLPVLKGLPRFAAGSTSRSAQIARDLLKRDAVRALEDSEEDIDNSFSLQSGPEGEDPFAPSQDNNGLRYSPVDKNNPEPSSKFMRKTIGKPSHSKRPSIDEAFGVMKALGQLQRGEYPPERDEASANRRELEKRRSMSRERLFLTSAMDDLTYDDADVLPGASFWRYLPCSDTRLAGGFAPDTLLIEPDKEDCVVLLNTGIFHRKNRKNSTERFIIAKENLAHSTFQDAFLQQVRKTRQPKGQPLYVLKRESDAHPCQLLFTIAQVKEILTKLSTEVYSVTGSQPGATCLQRYVRPSGRRPWFVRLIHADNGPSQVFTITSRERFQSRNADDGADHDQETEQQHWLTPTSMKMNEYGSLTLPESEIVYGGAKKEAAGTFQEPRQVAQAILDDIARHTGAKFQKVCFEYIRTQSSTWHLINVRGYGGLQRPKVLGAIRAITLYPNEASETGLKNHPACHGDYCDTLGRLKVGNVQNRSVFQYVINDDRRAFGGHSSISDDEDDNVKNDDQKPAHTLTLNFDREDSSTRVLQLKTETDGNTRVSVCQACAKIYRSKAQQTSVAPFSPSALDYGSDSEASQLRQVALGGDPNKQGNESSVKEENEDDSMTDYQGEHHESSAKEARRLSRRGLHRQKSSSGIVNVPYSSDMLNQNRNLYAQMIEKQRKHLQAHRVHTKPSPATMEEEIQDKLLASPTEDFALF